MKRRRDLASIGMLVLALIACNMQAGQSSQPDLPGTITAQALTLQARGATPVPASGSPSDPSVSVTSNTECRAGPGTQYGILLTLSPGGTARVVGKNTSTGHWIIENPAGDPCWLPERDAVFTGDASTLTDYPVPAAPTAVPPGTPQATKTPKASKTPMPTLTPTIGVPYTPGVPNFPTYVTSSLTCTSTTAGSTQYWIEDIVLTWHDNADNETGYRIYLAPKDFPVGLGETLGPNVTELKWQEQNSDSVNEKYPYVQYWVVAFNDVGESIRMGTVLNRCH